MAERKADGRGNSGSIYSPSNAAMGHLVKSLRDAGMASISNGNPLGKATSLPGAHFRPICSPFRRLEGVSNGS